MTFHFDAAFPGNLWRIVPVTKSSGYIREILIKNIAIVGMGYVGLPLALQFWRAGCRVFGLDIDPAKVCALNAGQCYIRDVPTAVIGKALDTGRLQASTEFSRVAEAEAVILCVPTPLNAYR